MEKHIEELKGESLLNAVRNYIEFNDSDMDVEARLYFDNDITLEEFIYNLKQFEFDEYGEIV